MATDINLKVLIYDHDAFALHAINSYLAWDRRTRVHFLAIDIEEVFEWLVTTDESEWPNIIILDTFHFTEPAQLSSLIKRFLSLNQQFIIAILEHQIDSDRLQTAVKSGARAYFLRSDVSIYIASALVWLRNVRFGISASIEKEFTSQLPSFVETLPESRQYPELTERIRQAIQLCVVEGMSADLAADEMGVSPHTIRSYVKEGYRILEAYDDNAEYPIELSAQERAFIRYTSLEQLEDDSKDKGT